MQAELDTQLGFQPDIYQRYAFLARLIEAVFRPGSAAPSDRLCLLDVGSGPVRLTETFLPEWVDVTRTDVSTFDDPAIVLIDTNGSLSFADGSMDVVLAMDVLEHIPNDQRARVMAECQRVARRCVIFAGPVHTPEVVAAEQAFKEFAKAVSGRDILFLDEHARFGLPDVGAIAAAFDDRAWQVVTADNSPLAEWQVFNAVDFLYASDLGEGEAKHATNAVINRRAPFARAGSAHYRKFVCGFRNNGDAERMQALVASTEIRAAALSPLALAAETGELLARIRADIHREFDRNINQRDASLAHLNQELRASNEQIDELTDLVARREASLADATFEAAELKEAVASLEKERAAREELTALLERQIQVLHDQSNQRLAHVGRLEQELTDQTGTANRLQRDLDRLQSEIGSVRSLVRHKLSGSYRRATGSARQLGTSAVGPAAAAAESQARDALTEAQRHAYAVISSSPLFDPEWYRSQSPEAAGTADPFLHYVSYGAATGSSPHALFDPTFYLGQNPDVAAAGLDPLVHYITCGAREGRQPHPLFDGTFYVVENPDVAAAGMDPLLHYITHGHAEGRRPHPLFDPALYLSQAPDADASSGSPLAHYLVHGASNHFDPHPLFDTSYYLERNPDVAATGINPLVHFLLHGAREGRNPHPSFETSYYLDRNPDLEVTGLNPLVHYVTIGARTGQRTQPELVVHRYGYTPPEGLLPWFTPLKLSLSEALANSPRLNVLVPGLAMKHMSGGPNTAIALACALAERGVAIRFVSTDAALDADRAPFWEHVKTLTGAEKISARMELVDAHDRTRTTRIGENDVFMATAWWTAQQAKYATRLTKQQTFLYLIQDYEPLLHAASTPYALASETYELPHLPIINTSVLHEFLSSRRIGHFQDEAFSRAAMVFEPALDQTIFHPPAMPRRGDAPRRLLFYARPTNGLRNLFELGVAALQKAVGDGVFDDHPWEFVGMGEQFAPVSLGRGAVLKPAEWLTLEGYARQMRESDVLLSLMLSPHPSYPPLEMAASGGLSVTTTFANKTAERLSSLSPSIIGVPPTIEGISEGIATAVRRLTDPHAPPPRARLALPQTWADSFGPILPRLLDELAILQASPTVRSVPAALTESTSTVLPGFKGWAANAYDVHRRRALAERRRWTAPAERDLLSFLTPVFNTHPAYLDDLARTVLSQDGGTDFEWIVLDNGSTHVDTCEYLARLAEHRCVQLHRVEENLGIVGGVRFCFERARNRYVIPLDSDDLLTPDAVGVLAGALRHAGYPALAYSDEDKLEGTSIRDPYFKPDWDPVLFVNSCYIAHLCAIDRRLGDELGVYTDREADGCHDWDTFMRFYLAGHKPLHVPEVLYSWRMHSDSTAGNFRSKPYVFVSHQRVLNRLLAAAAVPELYELQPSPLFLGTPDWWIRRAHRNPTPVTTVLVTPDNGDRTPLEPRTDLPHTITSLNAAAGPQGLREIAARCAEKGHLVHVLWSQTTIEDPEWPWEAMTHFELFKDTAMIGGRIHDDRHIITGSRYFGFGGACDSPDAGRTLNDPGYFAQMWKQHSVSAVSSNHCVIRADFLVDALTSLVDTGASLAGLGQWLGAAAHVRDLRVVYSPFFVARSDVNLETAVSAVERAAFRSTYRQQIPETRYLSPSVGLSPATAYRAVAPHVRRAELALPSVQSYQDWSSAEAVARAIRYAGDDSDVMFSVLTTVYSGTNADLFRETARSLFDQRRRFREWIILAHGPITAGVEEALSEYAADPRIRVIRRDTNVGIVNGLSLCLHEASGDYVVPMDADDLITPDALHVLAAGIREAGADMIYSDEDTYHDGSSASPFLRPDFDSVLNAENSYVWHLCAFRRDAALRLGVYSDPGAEFCHDWDTICRFAADGATIAHAPHVLYHWRIHAASQSNSGGQNPGSIASTKHLLSQRIADLPNPALYTVAPFPIFRGAEEWVIQRLPLEPPSIAAVRLADDVASPSGADVFDRCDFPFHTVHGPEQQAASTWTAQLRQASRSGVEYVLVVGSDCSAVEPSGVWEAIKLLELHQNVAIVSGRLVNAADDVVECGTVSDRFGRLISPFAGLARTAPGPFAMALKAHRILCPADGLWIARTDFLARALDRQPGGLDRSELSTWLGACAIADDLGVAYSPLLEARARTETVRARHDADDTLWRFVEFLGASSGAAHERVFGVAGFFDAVTTTAASEQGTLSPPRERLEPVSS